MKTPNEPTTRDLGNLGAPIRPAAPAPDKLERVSGDVYRNTRTGQLETRQPLPK